MTNLTDLTVADAREGLRRREFTAVELTDAYLKNMEEAQILNAYIAKTVSQARDMAKQADQDLASGKQGLMTGIPLGIKDLFCTKGIETTAANPPTNQQ
jgi:aspartyl-tRNA(Asn)/glutamyl-tRNA(Gln) amidotransferase subunit A